MCEPITLAAAALAVAGAGTAYQVYSGEQQRSAQKDALNQQREAQNKAEASALKQEKAAEEATNRSLAKRPDTGAILSAAEQASKTGVGSTMLTGSQGVDPSSLALDKKTLLGG